VKFLANLGSSFWSVVAINILLFRDFVKEGGAARSRFCVSIRKFCLDSKENAGKMPALPALFAGRFFLLDRPSAVATKSLLVDLRL